MRFRLPPLRLPRPGRSRVSDAVEAAGLGCLDAATWCWNPLAGLAVLGGLLLFVGWVIGDEPAPPSSE